MSFCEVRDSSSSALLHALLVVLNLIGLEDLDLEILENRKDVIDFLLVLDGLGQRLVDVIERQITLLFREPDEVTNLVIDAARRDLGAGCAGFSGGGFSRGTASTASDLGGNLRVRRTAWLCAA